MLQDTCDKKNYWKYIKELINKDDSNQYPDHFIIDKIPITDKKKISNSFNDFFTNIGPTLADKIKSGDIEHMHYLKNPTNKSMFLEPTYGHEIRTTINNLKNSAAGFDGYNLKVINAILNVILSPIVHIVNVSFLTGVVPIELKTAKVIPLFKSEDPHQLTNYRPISILPVLSKTLEKLFHKRLYKFLSINNILYQYQFGFRENHSTELALVTLNHNISTSFNSNKKVLGIFLDFSKAFDTINFQILLDKMQFYGIRGTPLLWIKNYLTPRTQYVVYDNIMSEAETTKTGVPQGSILGPLFFLIYINDLYKVSKNLHPLMYADDSNLFISGHNSNELIEIANSDLNKICQWINANKLSLNLNKTKYMLFSKSKTVDNPIDPLLIDNDPIQRTKTIKFLGYMIDENLNWSSHIQYLRSKIGKMLGILTKLQKTLNTNALRNLYFTFIHAYLTNGLTVWGSADKKYLDPLIKNQKKAIRIITFSPKNAHTSELFSQLRILPLPSLYNSLLAIFMFKVYHSSHPAIIQKLFSKNPNQNNRQKHHFKIPFTHCKSLEKSIAVQGPKMYNRLFQHIDINCSIFTYKKHIKTYFSNSI